MQCSRVLRTLMVLALALVAAVPALAQQTGSIVGKVVATDGSALPGVTVEARSDVLPSPRVTVTGSVGDYRLPALPVGTYTLTFTLQGMQTVTRQAAVQLAVETVADATLGVAGVTETITVRAGETLVNRDAPTIQSSIASSQIRLIPVGQEYRDLIKLIPGVQYTQDSVRGPSAGGSGQDNVYQFDGVNVTLPLFGTLSTEPASHDIAQITTTKGGARAIDFDRSGGFTVDSVSKSGTSRYAADVGFQFQTSKWSADLTNGSRSRFQQNRTWLDGNLGGPLVKDRVFFFASYYRPRNSRDNQSNVYGELPDYSLTRNEGFGKVTLTPRNDVLLNFSYRDSKRTDESDVFSANAAPTTGTGGESRQKIGTADGSWVINSRSFATFKYTNFSLRGESRPDNVSPFTPSLTIGAALDLTSLDRAGLFTVPVPVATNPAYSAFVAPLISRYGFLQNGVATGGGLVGFASQFDENDFFRNAGQFGYNLTLTTGRMTHDLHVGYQRYVDAEELTRSSNGFGVITVPGGRTSFQGRPIFYQAAFQQQGFGTVPPTIRSEYQSQSFEFNDTIRWNRWTINAGILASNDTLYGQGLREDSSTLSGYVLAIGNKYKMYEIPFSKMIQPRVGATWSYNGRDTVFASYARYNPAASSLPRAASWDRNLARTINAYFDQSGILFATDPVASSSGKLFVEDMTPRRIDEILIGASRQFTDRWSGRVYGRYREGSHYWEDTNNNARVAFNPNNLTVNGVTVPRVDYIPDLTARRTQIGSGSTYVIAELDGAFTEYKEVTFESEWRSDKMFVRGSYTWSKYYGNFDQDNSTTGNDANIFIGSSFIADDAGRQLWDNREGILRGDRPHMFKLYGYYSLDWNATIGTYIVAQSGQPWERWSFEPYRTLTTSTSDVSRFAEPAGSRRSPAHAQMDLNYTQNFKLSGRYNVQVVGDLFNLFNKQTGYNFAAQQQSSLFGQPRNFFDPRRFQLAVRIQF